MQLRFTILLGLGALTSLVAAAPVPEVIITPKEGVHIPRVGEVFENGYAGEDTLNGAAGKDAY